MSSTRDEDEDMVGESVVSSTRDEDEDMFGDSVVSLKAISLLITQNIRV